MKKFAKFMSLVMCVTSLGSFGVTSANAEVWTKDSMTITEFDFSDKSESTSWFAGTEIFDTQKTGPAISCLGGQTGYAYRKIDDEHGLSLAMSGGSAIKYNFNRTFDSAGKAVSNPVKGRIHFSFDLYAIKGDTTAQAVLQVNKYDYAWDNLIIDLKPKADKYSLPQNGGYGDTVHESLESQRWYRIDLNMDAGENATIVDVFVNGKYQSTTKVNEALNSLWLTSRNLGSGTSNRFVVDNIRVQSENVCGFANAVDFNEQKASESLWANAAYSYSDSIGGVFVKNSDTGASYQKIDNEHETSYAMAGGAAFKYIFNRTFDTNNAAVENAVTGKFKMSFDMYNKLNGTEVGRVLIQLNNSESYYDAGVVANFRYSTSKYCSIKNGSFTWDYSAYTPEIWHKVDLEFDAGESTTTVKLYLDGAYVGTKTYSMSLKSIGFFPDGSTSKCYTAIDNVKVSAMADEKALTAKALVSSIKDDAESVTIRYTGTLDRASVNDEPQISVSEYDKDTGITRAVDAYAEIDYTATRLNVYFNEKLNDNSELTITLPSELKGLFKEDIATETVNITTKMSMDYADNFESYSNAAKMPRFSNREFSGAEGYFGGKALTSEYNQNTIFNLPEAITVDNATTDYIVSFDMKIPDDSKYVQFYVSYNSGSAFQWKDGAVKREYNSTGTFTENKWHHYDFVFDFDGSDDASGRKRLHVYQDGVKLTSSASYGLWGTLSYVKLFAEENYPYHIDNFHARYRNEIDTVTDLEGLVSASTKEAYVKFDDAMDTATLTGDCIWIEDENGQEVDCTIEPAGIYTALIKFNDGALEKGKEYTLVIDGVNSYAGEKLSGLEDNCKIFNFTADEKFNVTDVKIINGDTEINSVADWDNQAQYDVMLTLESTRANEQTIYVVVAGYKQSGELANVGIAPVKVTKSNTYTADLEAIDMTDAKTVKIFAVDGFDNLSPLMTQAEVLN